MKYKAKFNGRKINAVGIFYDIETTVDGDNEEQARLNLYERFDHIMKLKLTPIDDGEPEEASK